MTTQHPSARRQLAQCAALEARRLMSTVEGFDPATGILNVRLTDGNDNVQVVYYAADPVASNGSVAILGTRVVSFPINAPLNRIDVFGGAGDDVIAVNQTQSTVVPVHFSGEAGNDTLHGGRGEDWLEGGTGNDVLIGYWGHDALDGGEGNDRLSGREGIDTLMGGPGNNSLDGGPGLDHLYGGPGADHFETGADSARLYDFDHQDAPATQTTTGERYVQTNNAGVAKDFVIDQGVRTHAGQFDVRKYPIYDGTSGSISSINTIEGGTGSFAGNADWQDYTIEVLPAPTKLFAGLNTHSQMVVTRGQYIYSVSFGQIAVSRVEPDGSVVGTWRGKPNTSDRVSGLWLSGNEMVAGALNATTKKVNFYVYNLDNPAVPAEKFSKHIPSGLKASHATNGKLLLGSTGTLPSAPAPIDVRDESIGWYRSETVDEYRARLQNDANFWPIGDEANYIVPTFASDQSEFFRIETIDLTGPDSRSIGSTLIFGSPDIFRWADGRVMIADNRDVMSVAGDTQRQAEILRLNLSKPNALPHLVSSTAVPGHVASPEGMQTRDGVLRVVTKTFYEQGWNVRSMVRDGATFRDAGPGVDIDFGRPVTFAKIQGTQALLAGGGMVQVNDLTNPWNTRQGAAIDAPLVVKQTRRAPDGKLLVVGQNSAASQASTVLQLLDSSNPLAPRASNRLYFDGMYSSAADDVNTMTFVPGTSTLAIGLGTLQHRDNLHLIDMDPSLALTSVRQVEQGGGVVRALVMGGTLVSVGEATVASMNPAAIGEWNNTVILQTASAVNVLSAPVGSRNFWLESEPTSESRWYWGGAYHTLPSTGALAGTRFELADTPNLVFTTAGNFLQATGL